MKKQSFFMLLMAVSTFQCTNEEPATSLFIRVDASCNQLISLSRSAIANDGVSTFTENDSIGIIDNKGTLNKWVHASTRWSCSTSPKWDDKTTQQTFYAFYPYVDGATTTAVPMPDLTKQDGTLANLSKFDFGVATITTNYTTAGGKLDFTGAKALKHQYSLVSFTLQKDEADIITLSSLQLEGTDLFTTSTYNLTSSTATLGAPSTSSLSISENNTTLPTEGKTYYFLIHPTTASALTLILTYTMNNEQHTAKAVNIGGAHAVGNWYKYKASISNSGVRISGVGLESWTTQDISDPIILNDVNQ